MWYVEYLLLNRAYIKEQEDINSEEYDDLLSVESTLIHLINSGAVTDSELAVLASKVSLDGLNIEVKFKNFTPHRDTTTKLFSSLCGKISAVLGGIFTNVGYAHYMQEKYDLTDEQVAKLELYMLSNMRHAILSKPYTEKEI